MKSHLIKLIILSSLSLIVACGGGKTNEEDITKSNEIVNSAPIALISLASSSVQRGDHVVIQGSESSDPDKDKISYQWQVISPSEIAVTISNDGEQIDFIAQEIGIYEVSLIVIDAKSAEGRSSLQFDVTESNSMKAVITMADSVKEGSKVTLSGAASKLYSTTTFNWQIIEKPLESAAELSSLSNIETYFIADKTGPYKVQLTLNGEDGNVAVVNQVITADSIITNSAPRVKISTLATETSANSILKLSSETSDLDGDELTFNWQVIKQPTGSQFTLTQADTEEAAFSSNSYGEYEVELAVADGKTSVKKNFSFTVTAVNKVPIAVINFNQQSVTQGEDITLYGLGVDPDSNSETLTYQWRLIAKPTGSVTEITNSTNKISHLYVDAEGDYLVSLAVSDHALTSEPVTKRIRAAKNHPPYIHNVDYEKRTSVGVPTSLKVNAGDVEKDMLTFKWQVTDKPAGANPIFSNAAVVNTNFTAHVAGWYTIEVDANDGMQWTEIAHTFIVIVE